VEGDNSRCLLNYTAQYVLERKFPFTPKTGAILFSLVVHDSVLFASWHDKNDPTHVCFFNKHTWRWWARKYSATLEIIGADVILLQRGS